MSIASNNAVEQSFLFCILNLLRAKRAGASWRSMYKQAEYLRLLVYYAAIAEERADHPPVIVKHPEQ